MNTHTQIKPGSQVLSTAPHTVPRYNSFEPRLYTASSWLYLHLPRPLCFVLVSTCLQLLGLTRAVWPLVKWGPRLRGVAAQSHSHLLRISRHVPNKSWWRREDPKGKRKGKDSAHREVTRPPNPPRHHVTAALVLAALRCERRLAPVPRCPIPGLPASAGWDHEVIRDSGRGESPSKAKVKKGGTKQ